MKKKATSSSSNRASFESLQEAKGFVDKRFKELLKHLDDFFDAFESIFLGVRLWPNQTIKLNLKPFETKKISRRLLNDQFWKFIQATEKSMQKSDPIFDPYMESSDLYLYLINKMERWAEHISWAMGSNIFGWGDDLIIQRTPSQVGEHPPYFPEWEDSPYIQKPPGLCPLAEIKERVESERKRIVDRLPGILAYQNSLTTNKPKKSRSSEAIQKENDFLYLLDQYEKWKAKTTEETRRKRLNSKEWFKDFDSWTQKSRNLFEKYAESEDDNSEIDKIIKYAQKIKRERSKGGE
jgi:hypothetical protein